MNFTQKETSLLKDMRTQEQLCIEKYTRGASQACDPQLKDLFNQNGQNERQHLQTLEQISAGTVPQINQNQGNKMQAQPNIRPSSCTAQEKQQDAYLCSDTLSMEKHVSSVYNTGIFEFTDPNVRNVLNHIQKEEQVHGERIYHYMSVNGMYG